MKSVVALMFALVSAGGCYLKPAWSNGPVQSPDGARVSLAGYLCWDAESGHHWDDAPRNLLIKLKIENTTDQVLRLDKDAVNLAVGDDNAYHQWYGPHLVEVKPHAAETVQWSFSTHTDCASDKKFVIALRDAVLEFKP